MSAYLQSFNKARTDTELARLAFEIFSQQNASLFSEEPQLGPAVLGSFRTAILQAEQLLNAVRNRGEEVIHAYRLFPCERRKGSVPRSVEEIHLQFDDAGWGTGMKLGTVRNRVWEILEHVAQETERKREGLLRYLERQNFATPSNDCIDGIVGDFLKDFAITEAIDDAKQLQSEIARVVRRMIDRAMEPILRESGTSESPTDPLTIASFMKFLCGQETLADAQKARSEGKLRVRPYELFLYAKQQDFQTAKLTKTRKDLSERFIPEHEYTGHLSIMVSHGGAEAALEDWDQQRQKREQEQLEEERRLEAELVLKRMDQREKDESSAISGGELNTVGKSVAKNGLNESSPAKAKKPASVTKKPNGSAGGKSKKLNR